MGFDQGKLVELLRRSYFAVDGLWFMMAEKERGFEDALELDERVWQVMPKIQARKARELLKLRGSTLAELAQCFALKLTSEGHRFELVRHRSDGLEFVISGCPWLDILERADRMHVAETVAQVICVGEGQTWASEFSASIECQLADSMCSGDDECRYLFRRTTRTASV